MAADSLKDFGVEWVMIGLLFFSLISFATTFMFNNNPGGLGTAGDKLDMYSSNISGNLLLTESDSNTLLNISSQNNPEVSNLGSMDSVATSYGIMGIAKNFMQSVKLFTGWIITGTAGEMLSSVFTGLFGLLSVCFIIKWIRNGI